MVAESSPVDFSDFLPHEPAADWDNHPFAPLRFPILDSFTFEDAPFPQNIPRPPLPAPSPSWPTDETFPTFSEILLGIPFVQAAERGTLPFPPAARGTVTPIPPDDGAINCEPSYQDVTGVKLWVAGDQHLSAVVHTIPPLVPPLLPIPPLLSAPTFPLGWIKIPQRDYDHGRKQRGFKPLKPIFFATNGRPGMNLRDAFRKDFTGLDGRDDPMLRDAAGAISCRLLFPGYPDNGSSCQLHALNWTRNRLPIQRSKLAHEVARKVEQYLTRMVRITLDESVEDQWRIGEGFMKIENMFLVSLGSVSTGSFQPEIWVADPSVSPPDAGRG